MNKNCYLIGLLACNDGGAVAIDTRCNQLEHARSLGALVLLATHNPEIAEQADRQIDFLDGVMVAR